jgi:hypothetical protein
LIKHHFMEQYVGVKVLLHTFWSSAVYAVRDGNLQQGSANRQTQCTFLSVSVACYVFGFWNNHLHASPSAARGLRVWVDPARSGNFKRHMKNFLPCLE